METLKSYLEIHPFFKDLDGDYLEFIEGCARNVRFDAGEYLFRENQKADHFYIIRHGRVALELFSPTKGAVTIETIDENDVLGWSWLVSPYRWSFDAKAAWLTRAVALDAECLRKKCDKDHSLGYELMKRIAPLIARRLEATRLQLLDIYNESDEKRSIT